MDTGVVRELCYSEPEWLAVFTNMVTGGWTFHLSDVALAEIIAARESDAISENEWQAAVERIERILNFDFPCLPSKRDLFHLCGFVDEEDLDPVPLSDEFQLEYSRARWSAIKQPIPSEGNGSKIIFSVGGNRFECAIQQGKAAEVLQDERQKWINEMTRAPQKNFAYDNAVETIKAAFDSWAKTDGVPMSIRGDILAHVQAEWEKRISGKYSPGSRKRRNDGIDFNLPFVFLYPALLVTTDKNLRKLLRGLPSYQAGWTFLPKELADNWEEGILKEPDWR